MPVTSGLALVGGALAGSAAGAALDRWPRGETLLEPRRSRCTSCGDVPRPIHLIPVVSWLLLRGRCAACRAAIDPRLPALEAGCALAALGVVRAHGTTRDALLLAAGAVAVLLASMTDLERLRIPDRLTYPLALLGLAGAAHQPGGGPELGQVLLWAALVPLGLALLAELVHGAGLARPIGRGDLKLLVGVLALASMVPAGPPAVLVLAVLLGGGAAMLGLATGRLRPGDRIPFAPAIAGGYLAVALLPSSARAVMAALVPDLAVAP